MLHIDDKPCALVLGLADRCKAAGAVIANMDQIDGLESMHENWTEAGDAEAEEDSLGVIFGLNWGVVHGS